VQRTLTRDQQNVARAKVAEDFALLAHNLNRAMSRITPQLVEAASGRAGFASGQALVEAAATGMRNSIFNVFFTPSSSEVKCEIAAPAGAFRASQLEKMREKTPKSPFFRAVKL
jgi:hypothetical protein